MGLGGGLVKKVFSKSRSLIPRQEHECKWPSVRIYLCGDECESVVAEDDDIASVRSTEATMGYPAGEPSRGETSITVDKEEDNHQSGDSEEENSPNKLLSQEHAAILIQSAFRGFLARRKYREVREADNQDQQQHDILCGESEAASTEVQIGGSVENMKIREENVNCQPKLLSKSRSQRYRLKVEWDDSTVSSNDLKLRIQNRLEAMTRRERALAYAFSQQLRTCSTKKRSSNCESVDSNMGWSWLERWMATRLPENYLAEDCLSRHLEPIGLQRRTILVKNKFDISAEEKESCGSNDVSVNLDSSSTGPLYSARDYFGPATRNRLKAVKSVSRRKTLPDAPYIAQHSQVNNKKDPHKEMEKDKKQKQTPLRTKETKLELATKSPAAK